VYYNNILLSNVKVAVSVTVYEPTNICNVSKYADCTSITISNTIPDCSYNTIYLLVTLIVLLRYTALD